MGIEWAVCSIWHSWLTLCLNLKVTFMKSLWFHPVDLFSFVFLLQSVLLASWYLASFINTACLSSVLDFTLCVIRHHSFLLPVESPVLKKILFFVLQLLMWPLEQPHKCRWDRPFQVIRSKHTYRTLSYMRKNMAVSQQLPSQAVWKWKLGHSTQGGLAQSGWTRVGMQCSLVTAPVA